MTQRDALDTLNQIRSIQEDIKQLTPSQEKIELSEYTRVAIDLLLGSEEFSDTNIRELISKLRNQLNVLQKRDENARDNSTLRTA